MEAGAGAPAGPGGPGGLRGFIRQVTPLGLLISAYILVGVGRVHQHFSFLSPLHPALLTFFLIVGYVVINPAAVDLSNMWKTWPGRVVIALGFLAGMSALFGISLGASAMFILEEYASILIFATIMLSAVGRMSLLRAVMMAFVLSAAFWLYLSYFVLGVSRGAAVNGILRLDSLYTYDPNDICVIFNTALPLSLLFFRVGHGKWVRRGALLVALGIPGAVALSGSRGGLIGLVVTAAALLVLVREVSIGKKVAGVFVSLLVVMMMAPEGYWKQMGTILDIKSDYNWSDPFGRRQVFMRGLGYIMQYPVFGVGINQFSRAEGTIGPLAVNHVAGTALRFMAPHNTPLQVAADLGLPALLIWISIPLMGIFWLPFQRSRYARGSPDPEERFLYQACTYMPAAWVGFFFSSLFVSFAYLVPYYIMLAYTAGVLLAMKRWSGPAEAWVPAASAPPRRSSEWRSRRPGQATPLWDPRITARNSASLEPGDGFAHER